MRNDTYNYFSKLNMSINSLNDQPFDDKTNESRDFDKVKNLIL
jgi:hypothetical protein